MNPFDFLERKASDLGAAASNQLPDRANLFLRYMSGLGNKNLDLDERTLSSLRESTFGWPTESFQVHGPTGLAFVKPGPWSFESKSGAVDPYGKGYGSEVTHTLGRFNSNVNPDKTSITMTDTYDMENEIEDPDLVSGKFQPIKAAQAFLDSRRSVTNLGRGLMYLAPFKPKPFNINVTVPYEGRIGDSETYAK